MLFVKEIWISLDFDTCCVSMKYGASLVNLTFVDVCNSCSRKYHDLDKRVEGG